MLRRYWFLLALLLVVPVGFLLPEAGELLRQTAHVMPLLVGATLLISGFLLDSRRLVTQAANVRALLLGLSATYVVAPLLGYGLAVLLAPGSGSARVWFVDAVMIAAAQAGTLASAIALTVVARGNQELALVLTVSSNFLTAALTPLILKLSTGTEVAFSFGDMMLRMAQVVLLPVLVGQILRHLLWRKTRAIAPLLGKVPQLIILVFVYAGVSAAAGRLGEEPLLVLKTLVVCAALHGGLLSWTYWGATFLGFDAGSRSAVVFCGSQKTLPNGMYLWDRFFGSNPYGAVPLVVYHLLQLVVDTFLVPWLEPRRKGDAREQD